MNLKKLLNNKIFIFIVTALIFGTIGVSAATYFASSQVTYDNKTSGLNATNVQGAIDELYETCTSEKIEIGEEEIEVVTKGDGLYKDEDEGGKYTYKGANPNNYLTFNGENAGWRIISINWDGTIKIMREQNIGIMEWNTWDNNEWDSAALNSYLNGTYYNSLNATAQSQIVTATYFIGSIHENYRYDMQNQVYEEIGIRSKVKVALPTLSEYIRSNSDKEYCGTLMRYQGNYTACNNSNWMFDSSNNWWTLSATTSFDVFYINYNGKIGPSTPTNSPIAVRPTVTLSSEVQITGGDGSQSNPYRIE